MVRFDITTREQLKGAAETLAHKAQSAAFCIVLLEGDLGAGKTTFSQEVARYLGVQEEVQSPTYSLLRSYEISGNTLHHLDLYRVTDRSELDVAGVTDMLCSGKGIYLIEWPRFLEDILPLCPLVASCSLTLTTKGERFLDVIWK